MNGKVITCGLLRNVGNSAVVPLHLALSFFNNFEKKEIIIKTKRVGIWKRKRRRKNQIFSNYKKEFVAR